MGGERGSQHTAQQAIFDDVAERLALHFFGGKVNVAGALGVPHPHIAVRTRAQRDQRLPHAEPA